ncbi:MAG: TIGR00269 family protein [Nanoarchaeota archaeon]|nr:TIGR00269 family protein [Nanoarchaeota archaeon]MBU1644673.1 TIGR00269 family protein [Nanoarchaeota archaeon]
MDCDKCKAKAVITLQHGNLCKNHFLKYFEEKVFKTINKFQLLGRDEKICVATSGGKDSLTVLYLTKKYIEKYHLPAALFALAIDEGITSYREKTLADLQEFCAEHKIKLHLASFEDEFGEKLETAVLKLNQDVKRRQCNICGVWRRYLLNKYAKKLEADKVVTGHNLDDEAQAILMNTFKANTKLAGRLGPKTGTYEHERFIPRVKPLYFCSEKEVRLYTLLKGFKVQYTECPYSKEGYRHHIQEMLNEFENKFKGTKQGIINSYLALLPLIKNSEENLEILSCKLCQEPANKEICNACNLREELNRG